MTLATAKKRWAKRRRRYAVGYINAGNLTYLAKGLPMTRREAVRFLNDMPSPGCAIFELVPVGVNR